MLPLLFARYLEGEFSELRLETEFQEIRALLGDSLPDYGDRAVGVANHRLRYAAHQSPPYPASSLVPITISPTPMLSANSTISSSALPIFKCACATVAPASFIFCT